MKVKQIERSLKQEWTNNHRGKLKQSISKVIVYTSRTEFKCYERGPVTVSADFRVGPEIDINDIDLIAVYLFTAFIQYSLVKRIFLNNFAVHLRV